MKTRTTLLSAIFLLLLSPGSGFAQSVGINNDGSAPHSSAILDIKSANKGLLLPRVSLQNLTDNTTIPNPATSLLVFNTNTALAGGAGFYVWDGNSWVLLLSTANANFLWSINGNAGINGSHFIGTTDNARMGFRVNNFQAGSIDPVLLNSYFGYKSGLNNIAGANNVAVGNAALFMNQNLNGLVAIGDSALFFNNSGIGRNTAIGARSGLNTTAGSGNSFVGYESGRNNTIGSNNTALGWKSLEANSSSVENTAIGVFSLQALENGTGNTAAGNLTMAAHVNGSYNTAVGNKALVADTSGADNTAIGAFGLFQNRNGMRNTVVGSNAAYFNRNGNENTVVGVAAFSNDLAGNNNVAIGGFSMNATGNAGNTAIGHNSQAGTDNLSNATAVGANAVVSASNALVLGSVSGINGAASSVNVGIGVNAPQARLHIRNGSLLVQNSGDIPGSPIAGLTLNAGRYLYWNPERATFMAGYSSSASFLEDSVLEVYSAIFGRNTKALGRASFTTGENNRSSGNYSLSFGFANVASGIGSFSFGDSTLALGNYATASGQNTIASGLNAVANGFNVKATGDYSTAYGENLVARSYLCTVFGRNNDSIPGSSKTTWEPDDPLFIVGNGYGPLSGQRWNALTIYKDGTSEFDYYVVPRNDNFVSLGRASKRWTAVYAVNGVLSTSDRRMKKNILPLNYGLQSVMQLNPVSFEWKQGAGGAHLGFIAQEVRTILPQAIEEGEQGNLSMNYQEIIPVLTKAIQEQQKLIAELQQRLEKLEKK